MSQTSLCSRRSGLTKAIDGHNVSAPLHWLGNLAKRAIDVDLRKEECAVCLANVIDADSSNF